MRWMLLTGLTMALTGCGGEAIERTPHGLDWAAAPVKRLVIVNGAFHSQAIDLVRGQPVRLVFDNEDGRVRDFVTRLFETVQLRPRGPHLNRPLSTGLVPGQATPGTRVILQTADTVEYDIVPQVAGTYSVTTVMFGGEGVPPALITVH